MLDEGDLNELEHEDGPVDDRSASGADDVTGGAFGRGPAAGPSSDAPAAGGPAPEGATEEHPTDRRGAREEPDTPPTSWDYSSSGPTGSGGSGRRKKGGGSKRGRRTAIALVAVLVVAVVGIVAAIVALWPCDHEWAEATCTEPATCTKCGETEGEALGHDWVEATCTEPETCSRCGETEGEALGHEWVDATCTEPETCSRCGETEGEALGHDVEEWTVVLEATCGDEGEQTGTCTRCGEEVEEAIEPTGEHVEGEWSFTSSIGVKRLLCSVCGEVMESETVEAYNLSGYIVGEDLPAGEYKLYCIPSDDDFAFYHVYADSSEEDLLVIEDVEDCAYLTLSDGQYVELNEVVMVPIEDAEPTTDIAGDGIYKVGLDLEPGTYHFTIQAGYDYGIVVIWSSSDVISFDEYDYDSYEYFETSDGYTVTLSEGQYIELSHVDIE